MYESCFLLDGINNLRGCNLETDSSIVKLDIFDVTRTENVLTYERYLCYLYSNLIDTSRSKNGIKS